MLHLVFHSVNQYLAWGSHAYQYRVVPPNANMVAGHFLLMLWISLMIVICGIASHCLRRIRRRSCRVDATYSLPQLITTLFDWV